TTDATQDFCLADAPTVADLQVNETGVTFYTAATGATVIAPTTALVDGATYYASLTIGSCESATRLAITVTVGNASTPTTTDATQDFCLADAPTVADLQVNEPGVVFYTAAIGGSQIAATTPLADDTTYYATIVSGSGCESGTRLAITVNISNGLTPTTVNPMQTLCAVDSPTVADIQVDQTVVFYTASTGGSVIPMDTAIVSGTTYYASYTDPATGCESASRLAIQVTLSNGTTPITTSASQAFCASDNATVANIQVNETGVVFYTAAIGGSQIDAATALVNGTTYYASITDANGCESSVRLAITITIDNGATPTTTDTTQDFCTADQPTIADIQVNEPGVLWYATATGGTPLAGTDLLMAGSTYYGSLQTVAGCESGTHLAVTITLNNGLTPTTNNPMQAFCAADSPTLANIQVDQAVVFYATSTGGAVLNMATALVDGTTYYASYTDPATGCESATRLAIQVSVSNGATPTTANAAQQFCEGSNPTVADLQVNEAGAEWYLTMEGGTPLTADTTLTEGTTYYASITVNGCKSAVRLAVTVSLSGSVQATITGGGPEACFGDEVTYTTQSGNSNYNWMVNGGTITAGGGTGDNTVTVKWGMPGQGLVSVSYTDANGCGTTTEALFSVTITSCADITITKTVNNSTPNMGENVIFTITVTNTGNSMFTDVVVSEQIPDGYQLANVLTNMGTFNAQTGVWEIPMLMPGDVATLDVEVTVVFGGNYTNIAFIVGSTPTDSNTENNTAEVSTEPQCLTVYNEFTPNGDGYNDTFRIDCIEDYPNNILEVFNRYGSPVYKTNRYKNDWDGGANVDGVVRAGEKLPVGTYYYVLTINGSARTGWLYIMR
ncbi:T9SS C-terminal target domain-containing protein, partial [Flavobacterium subsaxonicum]